MTITSNVLTSTSVQKNYKHIRIGGKAFMACGSGSLRLSPTDRKVAQSIESEYLTIEEIVKKTKLPLFKVRSSVRTLKTNNLLVEQDNTFKLNN